MGHFSILAQFCMRLSVLIIIQMTITFPGLLIADIWTSGGLVWAEAKLPSGHGDTRGLYPRLRIC